MDCSEVRKDFIFLFDNELPLDKARAIRSHIEGCQGCAYAWRSFSDTLQTIDKTGTVKIDPYFVSKTVQKIENLSGLPDNDLSWIKQPVFVRIAPLAFSVLFALAVSIGLLFQFFRSGTNAISSNNGNEIHYLQQAVYQDIYANSLEFTLLNDVNQ